MSASFIDLNLYYYISTPELNNSRTFQSCGDEIACFSDESPHSSKAFWQLLPANNTNAFLLINAVKGPSSALSSFLNGNLTQPGFAETNTQDPRQYWDWQTTDPTQGYTVSNVGNGTNWLLDVHNVTEGSLALVWGAPTTVEKQPHWILTSASPIPNMPKPASGPKTIKSSYIAAIVVVMVVVFIAIDAAIFFWLRRQRSRQGTVEDPVATPTSSITRPSVSTDPSELSGIDLVEKDDDSKRGTYLELQGSQRFSHATTARL